MAWVIYGVLCLAGLWLAGAVGGLAAMVLIVASSYKRRAVKIMDVTSLVYFATTAIVAATSAISLLERYHVVIVWGVFALVAWATLVAGFPFTIQYARELAPRSAWETPLFQRLNVTLTVAWAAVFTVGAILGIIALVAGHAFMLGVVLPMLAMVAGFVFNNRCTQRFADQMEPIAGSAITAPERAAN